VGSLVASLNVEDKIKGKQPKETKKFIVGKVQMLRAKPNEND
jgi:hypothetical protein